MKCEEALRNKNELWAMRRTHEADFIARLNRVYAKATILRQRGFARTILFIAEMLGLDLNEVEERLTTTLAAQEVESENATIIEAIETDPIYQQEEVEVEGLRLSVQKYLRERKEFVDLTRNRFADVLKEMGYSKAATTWKRVRRAGRLVTLILPGLLRKGQKRFDTSDASDTSETSPCGVVSNISHVSDPVTGGSEGLGEEILAILLILRELCADGRSAHIEDVLRISQERGIPSERAKGVLKRMMTEGDVWEPAKGTYRLTEAIR